MGNWVIEKPHPAIKLAQTTQITNFFGP